MRKYIPIEQLFDKLDSKSVNSWFDHLTFLNILLVWAGIIICFGLFYHFFSSPSSHLYSTLTNKPVEGIVEPVYFSFITATTTGFGDIVPMGVFKVIAILEVVFGLMLLAFVTSKLVSIKQDVILNEVYDISFNEKVTRLRSSLLVFRQHLSRIFSRIEAKTIRKRELQDLHIQFAYLEDILGEIHPLLDRPVQHRYTKRIDPINTELIFTSMIVSFEKLAELITTLNHHRLAWKRDVTVQTIERCVIMMEELFTKLKSVKSLSEKNILDLETRKKGIVEAIRKQVSVSIPTEKLLPTFYEV